MRLNSLLEIARQYKRLGTNVLNEKYNNNLIQKWQNQIWNGYWYNQTSFWQTEEALNTRIYSYALSQYKLTDMIYNEYKKSVENITNLDTIQHNLKVLISFFTEPYKVFESNYSYSKDIDEYKKINKASLYRMKPLSVILRNYNGLIKKSETLDNSPFYGYKMTNINNEDLEIIPFDKCRSKQYANYLMFWTTENGELMAISYNHKIIIAFEKPNVRYGNKMIFVNPNAPKKLNPEDLEDIPENICNNEVEFYKYIMHIIKPYYIEKINDSITLYDDMANVHTTASTKIFKSPDFKYAHFLSNEIGVIYGVDLAKNNYPDDRKARDDYKLWLSKEQDRMAAKQKLFKQLVRQVKEIKEYLTLKDNVITLSNNVFQFQENLFEIVNYSFINNMGEPSFLIKTPGDSSYGNYYEIIEEVNRQCDIINENIINILEIIKECDKFQNIIYAKNNTLELQSYQSQIEAYKARINNAMSRLYNISRSTSYIEILYAEYSKSISLNQNIMNKFINPSF